VKVRSVLLVAALVATGISASADAAVRRPPPCKTILDPEGDSAHGASLDIVSADIASDRKTVTAVIRLASISKTNPDAPTGQGYYFDFTAGGEAPIFLSYTITPTTESFNYGYVDTATGGGLHRSIDAAKGVVDTAKKEIRISAPVGAWTTYGNPKVGSKITGITLSTYWVVGAYVPNPTNGSSTGGGSLQPADDASGKTYVAGSPSCVVPGK
jgi:hypothetical protein